MSKYFHGVNAFIAALIIMLLITAQAASAETRYRVKSSDNLNDIVERFYQDSNLSKAQLMVGVLVKNPNAFRGGNINFLLRGKRLTLPSESDLRQISEESASDLLSQHVQFFRIGITGDFPAPTWEEVSGIASNPKPEAVQLKQTTQAQTQKIDLLQQESNELRKQLEELMNAKADRDQRLLELEKTLKDNLESENQKPSEISSSSQNNMDESSKTAALEEKNQQLQQKLQETKSELAENTSSSIALERKVEDLQDELKDKGVEMSSTDNSKNALADSVDASVDESGALSKLAWLIPLLLLAGFLYQFFIKKKPTVDPVEDTIENYEAAYREANDDIDTEYEEDSLETSIKLDVARAYIEAEDTESALDILTEIMEEGSDEQRQQAHELLETISSS